MRYQPIPSTLFVENRKRFTASLPPGSACMIHSNDVPQTNADGTRRFVQNSSLFWLTGIDQEETILILFPDAPATERREMLFVRPTNAHLAIWEGEKLTREDATEISGIDHVHWASSFDAMFRKVMSEAGQIWLFADHHPGRQHGPLSRNHRFALSCKEEYPLHQYHNAETILKPLRMIKSPEEITCIRQACDITHSAFLAACSAMRPGVYEYEIEAEIAREIIRRGAQGFAYEPIIASGTRSCILHYISNDHRCTDGDIVLMDIGANYANYAADLTRTVPVNGRFSARQRAVYDSVLQILRQACALMQPGMSQPEYHKAVETLADKELVNLGLITMADIRTQSSAQPARSKYFLHRTTHYLGLDVHDTGDPYAAFAPGMVLTCEPGIYIREEGIGVRLENDIVITPSGNEDLMASVPIEPEEIEALITRS